MNLDAPNAQACASGTLENTQPCLSVALPVGLARAVPREYLQTDFGYAKMGSQMRPPSLEYVCSTCSVSVCIEYPSTQVHLQKAGTSLIRQPVPLQSIHKERMNIYV